MLDPTQQQYVRLGWHPEIPDTIQTRKLWLKIVPTTHDWTMTHDWTARGREERLHGLRAG